MDLTNILSSIVNDNELHGRFLNTLSLMENTGARKISACEDPLTVTCIVLKHAAEEHRHAFYLKKQIKKTGSFCPTYQPEYLLAPAQSRFYLNKLDIDVCRYLKNELELNGRELRFASYLLVTYAIEVRADELYPVYQQVLDDTGSKVNVKSIILEEEGHLEEMTAQLKNFSKEWEVHANYAVAIESKLFATWENALEEEVQSLQTSEG